MATLESYGINYRFLVYLLALCTHSSLAIDEAWLPWWISGPVRNLLGVEAPVESCTTEPKTCDNGVLLLRQPALDCNYPACPSGADKQWAVYCDPDCNGQNFCAEQCFGEESQSIACPDNTCDGQVVETSDCTPTDCSFSEWNDWANEGCTGLCNRTRTLKKNSCGGRPCVGRVHETKWCMSPCNPSVDCMFGSWEPWGICDLQGMKHRSRIIATYASGDGSPCEGTLMMVGSCGQEKMKEDCLLSDWMAWSGCSASCGGGGQQRRVRGIKQEAKYGGKPCKFDPLLQVKDCDSVPPACGSVVAQDCQLMPWSAWAGCEVPHAFHQLRTRIVDPESPGTTGGKPCNASIHEILPCPNKDLLPVNCDFHDWGPWSVCSKTCDRGQSTRQRRIWHSALNGGSMCSDSLNETKVCSENACVPGETGNCQLSMWSEWSGCTATCGQGEETRYRAVLREAVQGGEACADPINQIRACPNKEPCPREDCRWSDWTDWATCSKTCGTGKKKRSRTVKTKPTGGGKPCTSLNSTLEYGFCNTQECPTDQCNDGEWSEWLPWTPCTRTCGGGAQWRERKTKVENNHCGAALNGSRSEFHKCNINACPGDMNCEMSTWGTWGQCSKDCGGSQERSREIVTNSSGAGLSCKGTLRSVRSCNRLSSEACGETDCVLGSWSSWSPCSASCARGQHKRSRIVEVNSSHGGKLCDDAVLKETEGCYAGECIPAFSGKDCKWSDWTEWGSCTCDGTKIRSRQIAEMPENGVECDSGNAEEIGMCERSCGKQKYYCVWGDWSSYPSGSGEGCSATCGNSTRAVSRALTKTSVRPANESLVVAKLHEDWETCSGTEEKHEDCGLDLCKECTVAQDCQLSLWSEWVQPHGDDCNMLCKRSRRVVRPPNACGKSCTDSIGETKTCLNVNCLPQDCKLGQWSAWNRTGCSGSEGQKERQREIVQSVRNGGHACSGSLRQTASCKPGDLEPVACELGDWSDWGECSKTCGTGVRKSNRIVLHAAANGGLPCRGALTRIDGIGCEKGACNEIKVDCKFSDWGRWYPANGGYWAPQQVRERQVEVPVEGQGKFCRGPLKETTKSPPPPTRDCELTDWDEWGNCDQSCGGGQKFRTRQLKHHARNGGKSCPDSSLHATMKCSMEPCPASQNNGDCNVSPWGPWGPCKPSCGHGVQYRSRNITQFPAAGALGCTLDLDEVNSCNHTCPGVQHCTLSPWGDWDSCQQASSCGVGYRNRTRQVTTPAGPGGDPCHKGNLIEVAPSAKCPGTCDVHCVDGKWNDWAEWSPCSVTCGRDGTRSRNRTAVKATNCGNPAEGSTNEYEGCGSLSSCAGHVDCEWTDWQAWSDCQGTCNSFRTRKRSVASPAATGGRPCHGGTVELGKCNPSPGEPQPAGCPMPPGEVHCIKSDWSEWSICSRPCEGGYQNRSRNFESIVGVHEAATGECNTTLQEIATCNSQECSQKDINCEWADWQEWSMCDPRSSQKERKRAVAQAAVYGIDCDGPSKEVQGCTSDCKPNALHYCMWSDWTSYSPCSTACGPEGRMTRTRKLIVTKEVASTR